jgi:hypothetical protein
MKRTNLFDYICVLLCLCSFSGIVFAGPTTELTISVYDDETVLDSVTIDYTWMEENLPVHGDGITHYYHQGPLFQGDPWDPEETTNFKDRGAVKGTSVRDLVELVGGMEPDDEVMIKAFDGYHTEFPYDIIYIDEPRRGPLVICWYVGEDAEKGERQGKGYVPAYHTGMRLLFMSDNSTNAEGLHVFGNYDMNQTLPSAAQYFYSGLLPSTSGLNVKWIDEVRVYKGGFKGEKGKPIKSLNEPTNKQNTESTPFGIFALLGALCAAASLFLWRRF